MGTEDTRRPGRQRLREWIERAKFKTDKEAAETLGIHPVVLCQYLSGERRPDIGNAVKIEHVAGIAVESWLLNEVSQNEHADSVIASSPRKTRR